MPKRIQLINPNYSYFPGLLKGAVNYKSEPLGVAYLASSIIKNFPGSAVDICDAAGLNMSHQQVLGRVIKFAPEIVGITLSTITAGSARKTAQAIRESLPDTLIVFGGPHVSALPFENLDVADICVVGEGEETFKDIIFCQDLDRDFSRVMGIAYRQNGSDFLTKKRSLIVDLDVLDFPARQLLPRNTYRHIYPYPVKNPYYHSIITSRGCNYKCDFCSSSLIWNGLTRYRSLENVFKEMEHLIKRYNAALLFLHDDDFTGSCERVVRFCQGIRKYFPGLKWICHGRADNMSLELLREMKQSGCVEIQVGVESGNDEVLKKCNKNIDTATICKAFELINKVGINSWATFIIGCEGDSVATVEDTIKFSKRINPTYATYLYLSPLPGTKSFSYFKKKGYLRSLDWSKYSWHGDPVFETEALSKSDLLRLRKKAYREFYLRPRALIRYLPLFLKLSSLRSMLRNLIVFMRFVAADI